jgi:hypothetical protein
MQVVTDGHDTLVIESPSPTLGVGWIDHLLPFHRSTNVIGLLPTRV